MPKETFFNLKEEKRKTIERVALKEFYENGLSNSSVKNIVEKSKIATGSFYQYFENISDLFIHVFSNIAKEKMEYVKSEVDKLENHDFNSTLRAIYKGGILFAIENHEASELLLDSGPLKDPNLLKEYMAVTPPDESLIWFYKIVENAKKNGEIRNDLPNEFLMSLISSTNIAIINYLKTSDFDLNKNSKEKYVNKFLDISIDILLNGLKGKS